MLPRSFLVRGLTQLSVGDPGRNRTCDLQLRRLLLYPLSYGAAMTVPTWGAYPTRSDFRVRLGTIDQYHTTIGALAT